MLYRKRLNNNAVVALHEDGREVICSGRGIGFDMVAGETLDESRVEKVFVLQDPLVSRQAQQLLMTMPVEFLDLAEQVVDEARRQLSGSLSDTVIVHLADHMHMAVQRHRKGLDIRNMMLPETQRFYGDEYRVGRFAVDLLNRRLGTELAEDEAGFVALHLVNARSGANESGLPLGRITTVIQEVERIVRLHLLTDLDTESTEYRRFITHLRFFAERLVAERHHRDEGVGLALASISAAYPEAARCAEAVGAFLDTEYAHRLTPSEKLYLTIHIGQLHSARR